MKVKEILTIDLSEDIKNVIDLEDISEKEIQSEIENYIVTDGLTKEYADFVSIYTSNILETGVWISGFYGSGKSYFGKLLGYMISNRIIAGTPARERIIQRFTGINDEALVKNALARLDAIKSRVVFLDIAKQDTSKGLAFSLFKNFLRSLELPENEHGFFLLIGNRSLNPRAKMRARIIPYRSSTPSSIFRSGVYICSGCNSIWRHHLHRYLALFLRVIGAVHLAHPPSAEFFLDLVLPDGLHESAKLKVLSGE